MFQDYKQSGLGWLACLRNNPDLRACNLLRCPRTETGCRCQRGTPTGKSRQERKRSILDRPPSRLTGLSWADKYLECTQSALVCPTRLHNDQSLHRCSHHDHQSLTLDCMWLEGTASECQMRCCQHNCQARLEYTKTTQSTAGMNPVGILSVSDNSSLEHSVLDRPKCRKTGQCSAGRFLQRMESD